MTILTRIYYTAVEFCTCAICVAAGRAPAAFAVALMFDCPTLVRIQFPIYVQYGIVLAKILTDFLYQDHRSTIAKMSSSPAPSATTTPTTLLGATTFCILKMAAVVETSPRNYNGISIGIYSDELELRYPLRSHSIFGINKRKVGSYQITSHRIISHRIASCRITFLRVACLRVSFLRITFRGIISPGITSPGITFLGITFPWDNLPLDDLLCTIFLRMWRWCSNSACDGGTDSLRQK